MNNKPSHCPQCKSSRVCNNGESDNRLHKRYKCGDCGKRFTDNTAEATNPITIFNNKLPKSQIYVITAAQNATPGHKGFMASIYNYLDFNEAVLGIIPFRYRNPTSLWSKNQTYDEWWDKELIPFLFTERKNLCKNLQVLGDIRVQPTASSPLSGLEAFSQGKSSIVGHPKLQLKLIPTIQNELPNIFTTTGACTVKNYSDSKAGKKGEFHHTMGATVVEIQGDIFHMRQINALPDGSFMDLDKEYTPHGVYEIDRAAGLVLGDTHVGRHSDEVVEATFGEGGIVPTTRPEKIVWHDVLDGYAGSHHHKHDPFIKYAKHIYAEDDYRQEVVDAFEFVANHTPEDSRSYIVSSNHHDHLYRYIRETDWRNDPVNAEFYLETALHLVRNSSMGKGGAEIADPFAYWFKKDCDVDNVEYIMRAESLVICGIECSLHGDVGANGSRGSINQFKKISRKSIIGHGHSPGIEDGCYQVGTSTELQLEYNMGPSSWLNTHCLIYPNGKRSLINIIKGNWRL